LSGGVFGWHDEKVVKAGEFVLVRFCNLGYQLNGIEICEMMNPWEGFQLPISIVELPDQDFQLEDPRIHFLFGSSHGLRKLVFCWERFPSGVVK